MIFLTFMIINFILFVKLLCQIVCVIEIYFKIVNISWVTCFILLYHFLNVFPFINWVFAHLRSANLFFIYMTPPVKSRGIFQPQICCIIFDTYFATNKTMYQYKMYLYTHIHITYIYIIYKRFLYMY